ncbi:hypothetical protein L1887_21602 [Cichorium endivia]|nr:hypothetical protein L1887_21602 [Cichorium endivia]
MLNYGGAKAISLPDNQINSAFQFSFLPVTRACSFHNAIEEGKQVHAHILKFGHSSDSFSQNNLIHMYVSFKNLQEARKDSRALKQGEWIHDYITKNEIEIDPKLATTIIDMYCKCGSLEKALKTFNELTKSDFVSMFFLFL